MHYKKKSLCVLFSLGLMITPAVSFSMENNFYLEEIVFDECREAVQELKKTMAAYGESIKKFHELLAPSPVERYSGKLLKVLTLGACAIGATKILYWACCGWNCLDLHEIRAQFAKYIDLVKNKPAMSEQAFELALKNMIMQECPYTQNAQYAKFPYIYIFKNRLDISIDSLKHMSEPKLFGWFDMGSATYKEVHETLKQLEWLSDYLDALFKKEASGDSCSLTNTSAN